jgi:hypothetical protein
VEGIATLFVFGHVSGHLTLVKSSGSRFQFHRMLPSIHSFWFGNVLIVAMGTTLSIHFLMNSLTESAYSSISVFVVLVGRNAEHIPIHSLEAWNQIGRTSVEQTSAWELLVLASVCRLGATKWSRGQLFRKEGGEGPYMHGGS